ncbi:hypothetical protein [Aquabacterium sp.]|uniref:hypothetical protein n=1 Tax=Aquabacterium sp. TaxID=1872578 RepID=UPI003D6CD9F9
MSNPGFSADWLRLREPHDQAARQAAFKALDGHDLVVRWRAAASPRGGDATFEVTDLACGSGANLRELAPRLGGRQRWRLVDHDPALLAALPLALSEWAGREGHHLTQTADGLLHIDGAGFSAEVRSWQLDLARDLSRLDLAHTHLLTASALLDLVSLPWLRELLGQARAAGVPMLFALNVDGRHLWDPEDADDRLVHGLFSRHQQRDKGFGPALGPQAPAEVVRLLSEAGFGVRQAQSDWLIQGQGGHAMQTALIQGVAAAALEQSPSDGGAVLAWTTRRLARINTTSLRVGHVDIAATLDQPAAGLKSRSHS